MKKVTYGLSYCYYRYNDGRANNGDVKMKLIYDDEASLRLAKDLLERGIFLTRLQRNGSILSSKQECDLERAAEEFVPGGISGGFLLSFNGATIITEEEMEF